MSKKKKRRKSHKKSNINITIISSFICIACALGGFFIGNINSQSSEIKSLEKSNVTQESALNEKKEELSKLQERLLEKNSTIESLNTEISDLNSQLETINSADSEEYMYDEYIYDEYYEEY